MKPENDNKLTYWNPEPSPLSRRDVLRRALAIGCGALIPFTLIGCERKQESATDMAPPSVNPQASTSTKTPQASVHYQSQPNENGQRCGLCRNFIPESNSCQIVEGTISAEGWCDLWTKKA